MNEQPMNLTPALEFAKTDAKLVEAEVEMSELDKLAIEAGVDPKALALLYKGEKR